MTARVERDPLRTHPPGRAGSAAIRTGTEYGGARPLVMDVVHEKLLCDSEACALLAAEGIVYPFDYGEVDITWARIVLAAPPAIETSRDGSVSRVAGRTVYGTEFDITVVWWLVDEVAPGCRRFIAEADPFDGAESTAYQFHGSFLVGTSEPIMSQVVGCSGMDVEERGEHDL